MPAFQKEIPAEFRDEFIQGYISLIRSRMGLLCRLTISIYLVVDALYYMFFPEGYKPEEILVGLLLALGGAVMLFISNKAKSLFSAKLSVYLYTAFLLALMVQLNLVFGDESGKEAMLAGIGPLFVFSFFLVSVTIPWRPSETVVLGFMHFMAYTLHFMTSMFLFQIEGAEAEFELYFNGIIFLLMSFIICFTVRRYEMNRDIQNFLLLKEVESRNEQVNRELELASRIHKSIISHSVSTRKFDVSIDYVPVYYIGGDYVKYVLLPGERLLFVISDITGHGVPAALLVNRIHAEFERMAKEGKEPGVLMRDLNEFIKEDFAGSDMYLTAFCGLLDMKKMELQYSNHGHPPQYVIDPATGGMRELAAQTSLLGLPYVDDGIYQDSVNIGHSERILLYTDGVTETFNAKGEQYGEQRLRDLLAAHSRSTSEELNSALIGELESFKSGPFKDDICIMCITLKEEKHVIDRILGKA
ncbi:MAG: PP2C family protein-serine/threonine phosphatase [Candidatus Omnitrophica bacterium]|nr:PP2C family protein-serine/threonine phosphatase [Candidatus Omnitrophota bacterium]MDD5487662.1 PP2C family protein-serine/threonine phosphatase [Candidatus Omnitrophota bacterium]